MKQPFPWYAFWFGAAAISLVLGAFGFAILFALATWYCWP